MFSLHHGTGIPGLDHYDAELSGGMVGAYGGAWGCWKRHSDGNTGEKELIDCSVLPLSGGHRPDLLFMLLVQPLEPLLH